MHDRQEPNQDLEIPSKTPKAYSKRKSREPLYGEVKRPTIFSLTPTASERLDILAAEFSLSRSELIEQIARGIIQLHSNESISTQSQ